MSSVVGSLVGVGLRPLCVGQVFWEDVAGAGWGDGGGDEVLGVGGMSCGEVKGEDRLG